MEEEQTSLPCLWPDGVVLQRLGSRARSRHDPHRPTGHPHRLGVTSKRRKPWCSKLRPPWTARSLNSAQYSCRETGR